MNTDPEVIGELNRILGELRGFDDPRRATPQWKAALNQLRKAPLDANRVNNVVARRDIDGLAGLIESLQAPDPTSADDDTLPPGVTTETLTTALKAFKKRLRMIRLDEESQIDSRNPLSKGTASQIRMIQPPADWPREVWQALAKRGRLVDAKNGFYELPHQPNE